MRACVSNPNSNPNPDLPNLSGGLVPHCISSVKSGIKLSVFVFFRNGCFRQGSCNVGEVCVGCTFSVVNSSPETLGEQKNFIKEQNSHESP